MAKISTDAVINSILLTEQASAPDTPASGKFQVYAKDDGKLYYKNDAGTEVAVMANPMTTAGDIIYGGASGAPTRLAAGTEDYVLTMGATNPEWAAAAAASYPAFSGCMLTKSTTQNIDTATETAISFDGEVFDTDSYHDNSTNNTRLTAPATGYYMAGGSAEINALADQKSYILNIRKGGSNANGDGRHRAFISSPAGSAGLNSNPFSRLVYLEAGQYVELVVTHNNGNTQPVRESSNGTSFWIYRVG